jgi:hypothetical protein
MEQQRNERDCLEFAQRDAPEMDAYIGWVSGEEDERHKVFDSCIRGRFIAEEYNAPLLEAEKECLAEHYDMGGPPLEADYLAELGSPAEPPTKGEVTKPPNRGSPRASPPSPTRGVTTFDNGPRRSTTVRTTRNQSFSAKGLSTISCAPVGNSSMTL